MTASIVLVVDHDRNARRAAVSALEDAGHRVLAARNGGEAIALMDRHAGIDLLLTEVVMPGIGGFMLADIARVRRPEIKVLYATGSREIAGLKVERLAGALLAKPLAADALRDAVDQALHAEPIPPPAQPPLPRLARSPSLGF
jgi:CheY-like chemotaxis protein